MDFQRRMKKRSTKVYFFRCFKCLQRKPVKFESVHKKGMCLTCFNADHDRAEAEQRRRFENAEMEIEETLP